MCVEFSTQSYESITAASERAYAAYAIKSTMRWTTLTATTTITFKDENDEVDDDDDDDAAFTRLPLIKISLFGFLLCEVTDLNNREKEKLAEKVRW